MHFKPLKNKEFFRRLFTAVSVILFVVSYLLFGFTQYAFLKVKSLPVPLLRYYIISAYPLFTRRLTLTLAVSAVCFILAAAIYVFSLRKFTLSGHKLVKRRVQTVWLALFSLPLIFGYLFSLRLVVYAVSGSAGPVTFTAAENRWKTVRSAAGSFSLRIPPELQQIKFDHRSPANLLESLAFVPRQYNSSLRKYDLFELWVSTFTLPQNTTFEQYRESMNERLKKLSRYEILSTMFVPLGPADAVREEISVTIGTGGQRYSRLSVFYKGKVIVIKGVIGRTSAVSSYQRTFDAIASTLQLE